MHKTFFTSDHHFGHSNILAYGERSFPSLEAMNEHMVLAHNSMVSPEDTVFIVGDLSLGSIDRTREYLHLLNGKKILIRGNHDRGTTEDLLSVGYEEIHEKLVIEIEGIRVGLSHYPFKARGEMASKYNLLPEEVDLLVHGHVHQLYKTKMHESGKLMINVSVEAIDYQPISLDQVLVLYRDSVKNAGSI